MCIFSLNSGWVAISCVKLGDGSAFHRCEAFGDLWTYVGCFTVNFITGDWCGVGMSEYECPDCGDGFKLPGLHGHLRFQHGYSSQEASEKLQALKGVPVSNNSGTKSVASDQPDEADFGQVSEHVSQRLNQTADSLAAMRMIESLESGGSSSVTELKDAVEIVSALQSSDTGLTADEVRNIIRSEQTAVADGAGSSPVVTAIANGVTDPDTLEAIAAVGPEIQRTERKYASLERIIDSLMNSGVGQSLGDLAALASSVSGDESGSESVVASQPSRGPRVGDTTGGGVPVTDGGDSSEESDEDEEIVFRRPPDAEDREDDDGRDMSRAERAAKGLDEDE